MGVLFQLFFLKLLFLTKRKRRVVAFDLASMGELQFFKPVLLTFAQRNPRDRILIIHHVTEGSEFSKELPGLSKRLIHVCNDVVRRISMPGIDLFLATEQYRLGLDGVYSVVLFHGQPSKGLTFTVEIIQRFDALFLYGPLQKQAFLEFVDDRLDGVCPAHIDLYEIGYPKSDALLSGTYDVPSIIAELNLDPVRSTVLYAPAFNEGASLREQGIAIVESLAKADKYNVVVKLPIDCWAPVTNVYATGGIDWYGQMENLQRVFPRLKLLRDYLVDPLLACADVLVTCVSSVSFEFLALKKPVLFVDTPRFYNSYLKRQFPDRDTSSWVHRTTVNGGREFGLLVSNPGDLEGAIDYVLSNRGLFPYHQKKLGEYLLYNPGKATAAAVEKIEELLALHVRSRRRRQLTDSVIRYLLQRVSKGTGYLLRISLNPARKWLEETLASRGYMLCKTGEAYIDPKATIKAADSEGLSVCDYIEGREKDTRKRGRRNRIIQNLQTRGVFASAKSIVEIGPGTGMYMTKVFECSTPARYEAYETHPRWATYLKKTFSGLHRPHLEVHTADGRTLKDTASESCDLVHAHAVFVYLPIFVLMGYIKEAARVLADGGYLVFDYLPDSNFDSAAIEAWLDGPWRFPVVIPKQLLMEFCATCGFTIIESFAEVYGSSSSEYVIFRRNRAKAGMGNT
jgi:SAM-dependent methyltransferase